MKTANNSSVHREFIIIKTNLNLVPVGYQFLQKIKADKKLQIKLASGWNNIARPNLMLRRKLFSNQLGIFWRWKEDRLAVIRRALASCNSLLLS